MFVSLTRLCDRKHRSHEGPEFAGVDQAGKHCKLGAVGLADEESVAHALIASLFCGCGFLWNANLETAAELVPNMSGLILGFSFSGVLSCAMPRKWRDVEETAAKMSKVPDVERVSVAAYGRIIASFKDGVRIDLEAR